MSRRWCRRRSARQRRRSRSLRAGSPGWRSTTASASARRRHRHDLLPPARPQRRRRPELHAADHVQAHRGEAVGTQALHRVARESGATSASKRPSTRSTTSRRSCKERSTRRARTPGAGHQGEAAASPHRVPAPRRDRCRARNRRQDLRRAVVGARRLHRASEARDSSSTHARRCSARRTRSTGPLARRWRSARCSSRVTTARGGAGHSPRHLQPASLGARRLRDGRGVGAARSPRCRTGEVLDLRLVVVRIRRARFRYGYSVANPSRPRRVGGAVRRLRQRGADHHGPVPRRRPKTSGARRQGSCCCCRTASWDRGPSTARPASSASITAAAEDNIQVANATTAAQYFPPPPPPDAPRRAQAVGGVHAQVVAAGEAGALEGRRAHQRIVPGGGRRSLVRRRPAVGAARCPRVGQGRLRTCWPSATRTGAPVAVVRVEQLYPWPGDYLAETLSRYSNARELVWLQEEPRNMGPWKLREGPALRSVR